ncbi:hypothetical protein EHS25_004101 [Saitozyma podzolica]|uniref:Uncharacterized protein n=1 Tax=Saitozyma podzolica TaxID=1890683 RepID=A0A427YT20_9TREE|nr:hypothetical protein EHS25_004101 [Saitozyma podzolica]
MSGVVPAPPARVGWALNATARPRASDAGIGGEGSRIVSDPGRYVRCDPVNAVSNRVQNVGAREGTVSDWTSGPRWRAGRRGQEVEVEVEVESGFVDR